MSEPAAASKCRAATGAPCSFTLSLDGRAPPHGQGGPRRCAFPFMHTHLIPIITFGETIILEQNNSGNILTLYTSTYQKILIQLGVSLNLHIT